MLTDLNSLQSTINDLHEIVTRNQGANHETSLLVKQMEKLVQEIESKTRSKRSTTEIAVPSFNQGLPVV